MFCAHLCCINGSTKSSMSIRLSAGKRGRGRVDEGGKRISLIEGVCFIAELVVGKISVRCSFDGHSGSKERKKEGNEKRSCLYKGNESKIKWESRNLVDNRQGL
jgi:hypothetical protein